MGKIRVLLTDDHMLFRHAIRNLLSAELDIDVVGEAANASEAVAQAALLRPDVVLMDIGMAGMSSFEATRQIRRERSDTRVLFLSMYDDEDYLAECVEIGASGYVLKDSPAEQLLTGIREVHRGGSYLSPRLLTRLVDGFRMQGRGVERQPRFGTLTKREREILKMLAEGRSVTLETAVSRIDHREQMIRLETTRGTVTAARVIVTVPTSIIAGESLRFDPPLPDKVALA